MGTPVHKAGVIAGDFVFFGNQTDVFAPGIGYDTDKAVHDAFYTGRNTFQDPLSFDFVTASGGDVSYGYFTVPAPGDAKAVVNMPLFTSAATAFLSAGKSCLFPPNDDRSATPSAPSPTSATSPWARATSPASRTRRGRRAAPPSAPSRASSSTRPPARPPPRPRSSSSPTRSRATAGPPSTRSRRPTSRRRDYGLLDEADADVGLPLVLTAATRRPCPPATTCWWPAARTAWSLSAPQSFHMDAGSTVVADPVGGHARHGPVPRSWTRLANLFPAKVALVSISGIDGNPARGRRPAPRLPGRRALRQRRAGARLPHRPARARSASSRGPTASAPRAGPEYGIFEQDFTIGAGGVQLVNAVVPHEVDTTGWMSADMHLHATLSFDSGMALTKRLATIDGRGRRVRGLHRPRLRDRLRAHHPRLAPRPVRAHGHRRRDDDHRAGALHRLPARLQQHLVPTHGSPDPTCESGRARSSPTCAASARTSGTPPFTIVAHPRDGFFGYIYQLGVDPYTMTAPGLVAGAAQPRPPDRELRLRRRWSSSTASASTSSARPPSSEVVDWNRCHAALEAATTPAPAQRHLPASRQPSMLAPCTSTGEPFADCLSRNRTRPRLGVDAAHPHPHARGAGGALELRPGLHRRDADDRRPAGVQRRAVRHGADPGRRSGSSPAPTTRGTSTTTSATSSTAC